MKATDRHLKLESKRQTRITTLKQQFPNQDLETHSSQSSVSGPGQHQFLMSSSSTPQMPSIVESESQPDPPSNLLGSGDHSQEILTQVNPPIAEEEAGDDDLSWGIPVGPLAEDQTVTDSSHTKKHSPTKKKKHRPSEQEEGQEQKILLPSAMADTSLSSMSGVSSSLSAPSQQHKEQSAAAPSSSQLPPLSLRTRLQGLTSGLFKKAS